MHHPRERITHTTAFVTPVVPFDGVCSTPLATPDQVQLTELAAFDVDASLSCAGRKVWAHCWPWHSISLCSADV